MKYCKHIIFGVYNICGNYHLTTSQHASELFVLFSLHKCMAFNIVLDLGEATFRIKHKIKYTAKCNAFTVYANNFF